MAEGIRESDNGLQEELIDERSVVEEYNAIIMCPADDGYNMVSTCGFRVHQSQTIHVPLSYFNRERPENILPQQLRGRHLVIRHHFRNFFLLVRAFPPVLKNGFTVHQNSEVQLNNDDRINFGGLCFTILLSKWFLPD